MIWTEIGDFSSSGLNEICLRDDLILKTIKLIYKYCEETVRVHLTTESNFLTVEGLSRDRVSLARFIYRLPFQLTRNICYSIDLDEDLVDSHLRVYKDRIESDLPIERCNSDYRINLADIDKELKITLRIVPNEFVKMLRLLRNKTYILQLKVEGYRVYLNYSDEGRNWIEISRYVRPLRNINTQSKYPMKWVARAFFTFPFNTYVDVRMAESRPMKIIFIDSPKKKLYVYIAPLVDE